MATRLGPAELGRRWQILPQGRKSAGPDDVSRKAEGSYPVPARFFLLKSPLNMVTGTFSCLLCTSVNVRNVII